MSTSDKIHALLPVYNWSWWQIFGFALLIDWGAVLLLMKFEQRIGLNSLGWGKLPGTSIALGGGSRQFFPSFIYGDLFLPIGIASSAVMLRSFHSPDAWYASRWWNGVVLGCGIVLSLSLEIFAVQGKTFTLQQELMPSKLWHTMVFALLFYLATMATIPLLTTYEPLWAFTLALFGYVGWAFCVYLDGPLGPDIRFAH